MKKISSFILMFFGLILLLSPSTMAMLFVSAISLILLVVAIGITLFTLTVGSVTLGIAPFILMMLSIFAIFNPMNILWILGIILIYNSIKYYTKNKSFNLSSLIGLLLGIFAITNTKAAIGSVVSILGVILIIAGFASFFLNFSILSSIFGDYPEKFEEVEMSIGRKKTRIKINEEDDVEDAVFEEIE